ncbi:Panacea domain-containing protein [Novacetimonas hansenii]|uniref:Panacea domain-containing protein n=1 Tax=Novacetimonas hansenii TaxID=436 RepID=UPI00094FA1C2|nr:Panacea domain-containing protein [Novacetimonas hansenii]PYD71067.1 hypothetical protein CFR74_14920 [Novacetimonas hansenii]
MAELIDILGYICENYPYKDELSNARLTKMVYLSDWKSAIEQGRQISDIKWIFNHHGPYVDDVYQEAHRSHLFKIIREVNVYGNEKFVFNLSSTKDWISLTEQDIICINHVIKETKPMLWRDFIHLVYSTYPVVVSDKYSRLNLVELARRYKRALHS